MALVIRKVTARDTAGWEQLLKDALGADALSEQVYDLNRVAGQLTGPQVEETWVAELDGKLHGSISILAAGAPNDNPVANLGRYLALPGNYRDGSAEALLRGINEVCLQRKQIAVMRVPASDNAQQALLEKLGYGCAGFQPLKHLCMVREATLFYVRIGAPDPAVRLPLSQSLPQISELAAVVLRHLRIPNPEIVRDGLTGYPLQTELTIEECAPADYDACKNQVPTPLPTEISGYYNRGLGILRVESNTPLRMFLGRRGGAIVAGLTCYFDERDKCVRLVDAFASDELSTGALMQQAVLLAQEKLNAVYVEADFLIDARRALKSAEQLGFVPVAYLPGFYNRTGCLVDVVKMVKLNAAYSLEKTNLTPHARAISDIIDRNFQDQKVGVAVINLLRTLPIFQGLGDGELGKVARLFTQKLFRANEKVFNKGDLSNEAYIVMRGQIDIVLEETARPVASLGSGTIIGEQAFLDDAPRNASGIAAQPSILLVIQRPAFSELVHSEPHLGMAVMRNIALEVSNKLRKANTALAQANH
jgi:hypothetical protein